MGWPGQREGGRGSSQLGGVHLIKQVRGAVGDSTLRHKACKGHALQHLHQEVVLHQPALAQEGCLGHTRRSAPLALSHLPASSQPRRAAYLVEADDGLGVDTDHVQTPAVALQELSKEPQEDGTQFLVLGTAMQVSARPCRQPSTQPAHPHPARPPGHLAHSCTPTLFLHIKPQQPPKTRY